MYELRSQEVTEMLDKPPRKHVMWGNTFIILLVIAGIWGLSTRKLPVVYYTTVEVRPHQHAATEPDNYSLELILKQPQMKPFIFPVSAQLQPAATDNGMTKQINVTIEAAKMETSNNTQILYVSLPPKDIPTANAVLNKLVTLRVETGKISIWEKFTNNKKNLIP